MARRTDRNEVAHDSESKLRVMLIDGRESRSTDLAHGLEQSGCLVVHRSRLDSDIERAVTLCCPDVIIIDLESPDRDTLEGMCRIGAEHPRPIVMFVDETDRDSIRSAMRAGVAAYVVKGSSPERVRPVLDVAIARFQHHEALKAELRQVKSTLEERKIVERAKGILMDKRGLCEADAYAALRKMAMTRSMKIHDVAEQVLAMADWL
jgi:response regulator NasT